MDRRAFLTLAAKTNRMPHPLPRDEIKRTIAGLAKKKGQR